MVLRLKSENGWKVAAHPASVYRWQNTDEGKVINKKLRTQ